MSRTTINRDYKPGMTILDIFSDKIKVDSITNCWLWIGTITKKGYGQAWYRQHHVVAHRLSAHFSLGLIFGDNEIQVLHKLECKNRNCCNFEHLYIGDRYDNIKDSIEAGTHVSLMQSRDTCKYGHELSINKEGRKRCNICENERNKLHYQLTHP